jgi:hypothetical protein
MAYLLTVSFADEEYQAEVDYNVYDLWENAEIGHTELFEAAGVPYDPFEKWTVDEIVDMTEFSCVEIKDEDW